MPPHSNEAARPTGTDDEAIRHKLTPEHWCARALEILSEEGAVA